MNKKISPYLLAPALLAAALSHQVSAVEPPPVAPVGGVVPRVGRDGTAVAPASSARVLTRTSELVGTEVQTRQSEKLGKVDDLLLDLATGKVVGIVVSSGGILGLGDRLRAVPPRAMHYDAGTEVLHLEATREQFEQAPAFEPSEWERVRRDSAWVELLGRYHLSTGPEAGAPVGVDPNNSEVNRRDRSGQTLTPLDHGSSAADVETTARLRKQIMARQDLSVSAKNVKVITVDGKITLRGPVETEQERMVVYELAQAAAPNGLGVRNQLEVIRR
ncbi:MAG: PRC-barrel domain-containing protein [Verrucomicrobiales bacterium]|nr:PRC-barrel domain-containing protein [Verrucomicrobiales bacterium]